MKEDKKEPRDTTNFYQIKTFKQHQPINQSINLLQSGFPFGEMNGDFAATLIGACAV